jgi:hypothetical protein
MEFKEFRSQEFHKNAHRAGRRVKAKTFPNATRTAHFADPAEQILELLQLLELLNSFQLTIPG